MKRLLLLILLTATFLGGYYLGQKPGSPDIIGKGRELGLMAYESCQKAVAAIESARKQQPAAVASSVEITPPKTK